MNDVTMQPKSHKTKVWTYTKEQIEGLLGEYLGIEKVIWIKDGIDPYETNGHVDDVACFSAPGEVCCMWTDDPEHKFYRECQEAYKTLSEATDAKGRKLKIHKVIMPSKSVYMTEEEASTIDPVEGVLPRTPEDAFEPSYLNFLQDFFLQSIRSTSIYHDNPSCAFHSAKIAGISGVWSSSTFTFCS